MDLEVMPDEGTGDGRMRQARRPYSPAPFLSGKKEKAQPAAAIRVRRAGCTDLRKAIYRQDLGLQNEGGLAVASDPESSARLYPAYPALRGS